MTSGQRAQARESPQSVTQERISWFPVPDPADLPEDGQKLFAKARERLGFVPNVFRVYSFRPERLSAWFAHYRQLHEPTEHLDEAERELPDFWDSVMLRLTDSQNPLFAPARRHAHPPGRGSQPP